MSLLGDILIPADALALNARFDEHCAGSTHFDGQPTSKNFEFQAVLPSPPKSKHRLSLLSPEQNRHGHERPPRLRRPAFRCTQLLSCHHRTRTQNCTLCPRIISSSSTGSNIPALRLEEKWFRRASRPVQHFKYPGGVFCSERNPGGILLGGGGKEITYLHTAMGYNVYEQQAFRERRLGGEKQR